MPAPRTAPAYRIHTRRMVLRCWNPQDAPLLQAAINTSLEHLQAWMPWAMNEPEDILSKAERLRRFRGDFDLDRDFVYGIFDREETRVLGGAGLHPRIGEGSLEIGYWIHKDRINQGLATEAAAALTKTAFELHKVPRVEIHCDPRNTPSSRVPEKLGYRHEATLRQRALTPSGLPRDSMIWTLLTEEYPASPSAVSEMEAFDVMGRRLI